MNLNRISIGGGLALVAVGLLANAAVSLVGTPDRIAHADGMKRADKRQQQEPVADVVVPRQDESGRGTMAMGGPECQVVEEEPLNWFGEIRFLPDCLQPESGSQRLPLAYLLRADADGDGTDEAFRASGSYIVLFCSDSSPPEPVLLTLRKTAVVDGQVVVGERPVLENARMASWLQANVAGGWASAVADNNNSGWHDIDNDGDLDLVLKIDFRSASCTWQGQTVTVWIENTGFEKQQFAAGDINQDGNVDGVDISILLSDWSY